MKKYVPSGYQIIDLGNVNGSGTTVSNDDVKVLCDLDRKGRLHKKPILLTVYETEEDIRFTGFATISGSTVYLQVMDGNNAWYTVSAVIGTESAEVTISYTSMS